VVVFPMHEMERAAVDTTGYAAIRQQPARSCGAFWLC